jgi:hypothetical protein
MFSEKEKEKKIDEVRCEIMTDINQWARDEAMQAMIRDIIRGQEGDQ